jgi:hypothetical protein
MNIQELITLLSNKIASLNNARSNAVSSGDVVAVLRLDDEIAETQNTLNKLQVS